MYQNAEKVAKDVTINELKSQEANYNEKLEIQEAMDILTRIIDESLLLWEDYKSEIEENEFSEADIINISYQSKQENDRIEKPFNITDSIGVNWIENEEVKDKNKIIENSIANIEETKHTENN